MKKMTLAGSCLALLSWGAAQAATEFPGGLIPQELAQEFGGSGQFYSSLPDDFPLAGLDLGIDLQVIGSVQRSSVYSEVLLRSDRGAVELANVVAPALLESGWVVMYSGGSPTDRQAQLCHDQSGDLILRIREAAGGARLTVTLNQWPSSTLARDCAAQKLALDRQNAAWQFVTAQFPELDLPPGAVRLQRPVAGIRGIASDARFEMEREMLIQAPDSSAAALHEHFAAQMVELGWTQDSGGDGESSAGGVWLRYTGLPQDGAAPGGATRLLSSLTLIAHGGDLYEVDITLQAGAPGGCNPLQSPIGTDCSLRDFYPPIPGYYGPPINVPQLGIRGLPPGYSPRPLPVPYNVLGAAP